MAARSRHREDGPPWAWRLAVGVVMGVLRRLFGWRVRTRVMTELPATDQPVVVVYNHTSNVDPFVVAEQVWRHTRQWSQPLAKAELFDVPGLGALGRAAGAIPVARSEARGREQAFGAAVERLRAGGTVLIAPEGTITHDGTLLPLRHGAARLALDAGAHVLVVTTFGAQRGFSPVVRLPDRGAHVSVAVDVLQLLPDEDAAGLTGRIAATMLDRHEELRATYPQRDADAAWWPPYPRPATPSATAREHLEQYRVSMAETVASARERMAELARDRALDERVAAARQQARELAERLADEVTLRSRSRAEAFREIRHRAEELAARTRELAEDLGDQARSAIEQRTGATSDPALDETADPDPDKTQGPDASSPGDGEGVDR